MLQCYVLCYVISVIQIDLYLYFIHIQILLNVYECSKHRSCHTIEAQSIFPFYVIKHVSCTYAEG